ncbi:MAG: hypothetical protein HPY62_07540 [Bacteroidales bacterium]|nr:hypothetical protein [Bacteroidales bacterium]
MKFIFCTCNISMMDQVTQLLDKNGVTSYQITDKVISRNEKGTPRFDTAVWPGYNVNITMQISSDDKADTIIALLRKFNKEMAFSDEELLTVCSMKMDNYFFD